MIFDADLLTAIISLVTAGLTAGSLPHLLTQWRRRRDAMQWASFFSDVNKVHELLQTIVNHSQANRALFMVLENGGGIPTLVGERYSSIRFESHDATATSMRRSWQRQLIDESYTRLMVDLFKSGRVHVLCDDLPHDSMLRHVYKHRDVHQSVIIALGVTNKQFCYLSINFAGDEPLSSQSADVLRAVSTQLKNLLANSPRLAFQAIPRQGVR